MTSQTRVSRHSRTNVYRTAPWSRSSLQRSVSRPPVIYRSRLIIVLKAPPIPLDRQYDPCLAALDLLYLPAQFLVQLSWGLDRRFVDLEGWVLAFGHCRSWLTCTFGSTVTNVSRGLTLNVSSADLAVSRPRYSLSYVDDVLGSLRQCLGHFVWSPPGLFPSCWTSLDC